MTQGQKTAYNNFINDVLEGVERVGLLCLGAIVAVILLMSFGTTLQAIFEHRQSTEAVKLADTAWVASAALFRAASTGALVSIAAASAGGFLGMLFGIPKLLQQRSANPDPSSMTTGQTQNQSGLPIFRTNTSFEEISDWLTKIIVGLGLVQFDKIVDYLIRASNWAATFISNDGYCLEPECSIASHTAVPFIFALIISSFLLALLFVYLQTRTRLTMLFQKTEETLVQDVPLRIQLAPLDQPIAILARDINAKSGSPPKPIPEDPTDDDREVAHMRRTDMAQGRPLASWAASQARLGHIDIGENALFEAAQSAPSDVQLKMRLAEVQALRDSNDFPETALMLLQAAPHDVAAQDLAFKGQLSALFLAPPKGYRLAIKISEMLQGSEYDQSPWFHFRWACALGQKKAHEPGATPDPAVEASNQLTEVTQRSSHDDPVQKLMRKMLSGRGDRDLHIFKEDPRFAAFRESSS